MFDASGICSKGHLEVLEEWYQGDRDYKVVDKIDDTPELGSDFDSALYLVAKFCKESTVEVDSFDVIYIFPKLGQDDFSISIDYNYVMDEPIRFNDLDSIVEMIVDIIKRRILK